MKYEMAYHTFVTGVPVISSLSLARKYSGHVGDHYLTFLKVVVAILTRISGTTIMRVSIMSKIRTPLKDSGLQGLVEQ